MSMGRKPRVHESSESNGLQKFRFKYIKGPTVINLNRATIFFPAIVRLVV